jgi:hypothetical protein
MDAKTKSDRIDAAVKAHIAWFERLKTAIATGKSDFNPATVSLDNQCEFGKWVYSDLNTICDKAKFDKIKTLHAAFHKKASEILKLALAGNKAEATPQVTSSSELGKLSGELIIVLRGL